MIDRYSTDEAGAAHLAREDEDCGDQRPSRSELERDRVELMAGPAPGGYEWLDAIFEEQSGRPAVVNVNGGSEGERQLAFELPDAA